MKIWIIVLFAIVSLSAIGLLGTERENHSLQHFEDVDAIRDLKNYYEANQSESPPIKCGTPLLLEAWHESQTQRLFPRPTLSGPENILNTTHFKIHWTSSGGDASTAEYVDSIATFAEFCWEQQVDTMGWNFPPSDSFNPPGQDGGDYRYDIYVQDLTLCCSGYVQGEYTVPQTPEEDGTSYMGMHNGLSFSGLQVTMAHEFNHSCQFGHSVFENSHWYENTATWMEDQIYDNVNDYYNNLENFFPNPIISPEVKVTFFTGDPFSDSIFYAYGSCTWPMFLHEWNGTQDIVREIWTLQGLHLGTNTMADIDSVLRTSYSRDQNTAMKEYAEWRYFAGPNDDGNHFEEGGAWAAIPYVDPAHSHSSYPASGNQGTRGPDTLGANFIRFDTTGVSGGLNISFNGQNTMEWAAMAISYDPLGSSVISEISLDANGDGSIFVVWDGFDHIALTPIVLTYTGTLLNSDLGSENSEFTIQRSSFTNPGSPTSFFPQQFYTYNADFFQSELTSPNVAVIIPNGGETWSIGDNDTMRWVATDSTLVDFIDILISTDNGSTWDTVSSNESNDSVHIWSVANTPSDSCLIRIIGLDPWSNVGEDTSDAVFSIGDFTPPQVTVGFPNGGENLAIGNIAIITWSATDFFGIDSLTLEYSIDGGVGWIPISSGETNDGMYSWPVPAQPSDSCLVRITGFDPSLNTGQDLSDLLFTISDQTPPSVTVNYPNGGETWSAGTQDSIRWVASDLFGVDSLSLYLSTDGGGSWSLLSSGEPNDSFLTVNVQCTPSNNSLVRIVAFDLYQNSGEDTSNSFFSISDLASPQVTLNSPNGGEVFEIGDQDTIQWVATDNCAVDSLNLLLSTDGGTSWSPISTGEVNDSTYLWTIPSLLSDSCLIRIIAFDPASSISEDTSDLFFTITDLTPPQVSVIFPNGGETFGFGDSITILWGATDNGIVDSLSLFFSSDGGLIWDTLATGEANDSNFLWIAPSLLSDSCLIRITAFDLASNTNEDTSDSIFSISDLISPQVSVVFPNGGESFGPGDSVTIQWVALDNGTIDSLSLFFSSDGGSIWDTLATGEANDSSYLWIVPGVSTTQGLISILAFDGALNTGEDQSDSTFTILLVGAEESELELQITKFGLNQNHPNPFNKLTAISYQIPLTPFNKGGQRGIPVRLVVYDITGRLVETLVDERQTPGAYEIRWNSRTPESGVRSGIYFCRLIAGDYIETRKMILLR
jgi:hypothetical protein